jgi:hypothetical protein
VKRRLFATLHICPYTLLILIQFTFFMNVEVHARSFATHWSTFVIFSLRPYRKVEGYSNHYFAIIIVVLWLNILGEEEFVFKTSDLSIYFPHF